MMADPAPRIIPRMSAEAIHRCSRKASAEVIAPSISIADIVRPAVSRPRVAKRNAESRRLVPNVRRDTHATLEMDIVNSKKVGQKTIQ